MLVCNVCIWLRCQWWLYDHPINMHARQIFTNLFERIFSQQFLIFSKHSDQFSDCRDFAKCLNMLQTWQDRKTSRVEKIWSQISHDVLLLERGYLIKKLIMLIPGKICYRLVLQYVVYEKKVKASHMNYLFFNQVSFFVSFRCFEFFNVLAVVTVLIYILLNHLIVKCFDSLQSLLHGGSSQSVD